LRLKWASPWLVTLAGLVATYTRGAWIGFAAGRGLAPPTERRGRLLIVVGLVLLLGAAAVGPYELRNRVRHMFDPGESGIVERRYMWQSGLTMWRERPLLGWGPGGVKREYSRYALPEAFKKRTGHVHNTPLQIWSSAGFPASPLGSPSGSRSTGRPSRSSGGSIRTPRASGPSWSGASRR
jgi:O-antigen ligase